MPEPSVAVARSLRVGLTQLSPTGDPAANLARAVDVVDRLAADGPDVVLLPENCLAIGTNEEMRATAVAEDSVEIDALRAAAQLAGTVVVIGGFKRLGADGRIHNTALVLDSAGETVARYDKVHLFDAVVDGHSYRASDVETAGDHPVLLEVGDARIGLTICYDIRFPELYRRLALGGAEVVLIPAAFTARTGEAHWEVLNRARAIENGTYVVSSATIAPPGATSFATYGHALAVDPWGRVLADLGTSPHAGVVVELDLSRVAEVRDSLPVLKGVRPDAYAAAAEVVAVGDLARIGR
jgi:predicted amidohydrolase